MGKLAPYSHQATLSKLDGRTREARMLLIIRSKLVEHLGGNPTVIQDRLIERACQLQLRIALMDRKFAKDGAQTDHDSRTYLAWSNSLTRTLRELNDRAVTSPSPLIADLDWSLRERAESLDAA